MNRLPLDRLGVLSPSNGQAGSYLAGQPIQ